MAWEANHIYAPATARAAEVFCAEPSLAAGVYLIDRLDGVMWESTEPPPLPEAGLLVVRELASGDQRPLRWSEEETVSWQQVRGPAGLPVLTADSLGERAYLSHLYAPPASFLRFLKDASARGGIPVIFYHHDTFGGATEEFAWVFDPAGEDRLYVRTGETLVAVHTDQQFEVLSRANVLALVLRDLGVALPDVASAPPFPPHRLGFPWSRYRYDCHPLAPSQADAEASAGP